MDNRAQGSLEYLILIGGAVVIAIAIVAFMMGFGGGIVNQVNQQAGNLENIFDVNL